MLVGDLAAARRRYPFIAEQAHAIIAEFRRRYPDCQFSFSYDQAALVAESFDSVRDAIVLGLMLSVAVV